MKAPSAEQLTFDLRRLWTLATLAQDVRERGLQSSSLAEILATPELAIWGLDELFLGPSDHPHPSFADALVHASRSVAAAYRAKTSATRLGRLRNRMRTLLDAYDGQAPLPRAFIVGAPSPVPQLHVDLWQLPPGERGYPYCHSLGSTEVMLVLEGRPTLSTTDETRDLHDRSAACSLPASARNELLNRTRQRVRLLALSCRASPGHPV